MDLHWLICEASILTKQRVEERQILDKLIAYATDGETDGYPFEVTGSDLSLVLKALKAYRETTT